MVNPLPSPKHYFNCYHCFMLLKLNLITYFIDMFNNLNNKS